MSDDLEQRLQRAFQSGSLPAAPASLVEALDQVPNAPVRSRRSISRRSTFGLLAAALLVATVGALATVGGSTRSRPPTPTVTSTPSTATGTGLRLEYQWFDGFHPELASTISIIEARIASTGVVDATVEAEGTDRIIVALPGITDADAEPIRKLIGQIGRVDFIPLGSNPMTVGQIIDRGQFQSLFSGDQIASASVGTDQNGRPTIVLKLKAEGARVFADFTSQNIGSYFAVTVDDVVITAPVIQNGIVNGDVQITGGGVDGFDGTEASTIAALLNSGTLPFPIQEIGSEPANSSPSTP